MAGELRKNFTKGHLRSNSNNKYQDPTYLTFVILFDIMSPLFNKDVAYAALKDPALYNDLVRAEKLKSFTDTIMLLNKEMPWYWQSLSGTERAFEFNMKEPYRGGDDAKLEITCNESINLAVTGLMDMYKEAMYDLKAWTQILPKNYRKFNMTVFVSEVREINTSINTAAGTKDINSEITADNKPMFAFRFKHCEFDMNSGKETFETLSNISPEMPTPKITITYSDIEQLDHKYLHGVSSASVSDTPGVGTETPPEGNLANLVKSAGDRLAESANDAVSTLNATVNSLNPTNLINNPGNVYGSAIERALEGAVRGIDNTLNTAANLPGNILKDTITQSQNEANNILKSARQNIFGASTATTVADALRKGAINSIFPSLNRGDNTNSNLGNINK
tara:strand:+ start:4575 stop:5753 length:1179 start_codon:yes stop_codon:yes gene_type:complete